MSTTKTAVICGHRITLQAGRRYLASRPMIDGATVKRHSQFRVTLHDCDANQSTAVKMLPPMSYTKANKFLNAFNSDSFQGRVW